MSILLLSGFSAYGQSSSTKYKGRTSGKTGPWFHVTPLVGVYAGSFQKGISVDGESKNDFSSEGEATAGILIDYNSHKAGFALQTGLVMSKSNAVFQDSNNGVNVQFTYVDEYISIPLAGKFYPFSTSARWLYVRFGANLSYLTSSKRSEVASREAGLFNAVSSSSNEVDLTDNRERADIQALAGLGVIIPISKTIGVTIEGTYFHGFVNTDKTEGAAQQELYTQGTSGTLGISFAL